MVIVADALGYDVVIVETVGAGQDEADVAGVAPTVVVVEVPHLGDDIQSLKAGILEIASIYAVNKADQGGADQVAATLRAMLSLAHGRDAWNPPVLKLSARTGDGVGRLLEAIRDHRGFLVSSGRLTSWPSERARRRLLEGARDRVVEAILASVAPSELADLVTEVAEHRLSLSDGIDRLTRDLGLGRTGGCPAPIKSPGDNTRTRS
jgi:LAO/AO transport system kinase